MVSAKVLIPQVQSLARERVDALLARIWQHRVGLVVAQMDRCLRGDQGRSEPVSVFRKAAEQRRCLLAAKTLQRARYLIGFYARYRSGEIKVEDSEILDAAWFDPGELPQMPGRFSLARRLIDGFSTNGQRPARSAST